jgi:predicted transcriptional regulator
LTNYVKIYQKYINLATAVNQLTDFKSLDANETYLLEQLSQYWANNQRITVTEAMNMPMLSCFSISTIHSHLKSLRIKGYVQLIVDETDNRVKYVSASELTQTYFSKLGKSMLKATEI